MSKVRYTHKEAAKELKVTASYLYVARSMGKWKLKLRRDRKTGENYYLGTDVRKLKARRSAA